MLDLRHGFTTIPHIMTQEYFPDVQKIAYQGADSKNPLTFKHYNADEVVGGKSMRDHFRILDCLLAYYEEYPGRSIWGGHSHPTME